MEGKTLWEGLEIEVFIADVLFWESITSFPALVKIHVLRGISRVLEGGERLICKVFEN